MRSSGCVAIGPPAKMGPDSRTPVPPCRPPTANRTTRAEAFRPHAVLLDIGLPVLDGYEVARRLRANRALDGILLIALTGYGQDADRERSRGVGFDYYS